MPQLDVLDMNECEFCNDSHNVIAQSWKCVHYTVTEAHSIHNVIWDVVLNHQMILLTRALPILAWHFTSHGILFAISQNNTLGSPHIMVGSCRKHFMVQLIDIYYYLQVARVCFIRGHLVWFSLVSWLRCAIVIGSFGCCCCCIALIEPILTHEILCIGWILKF